LVVPGSIALFALMPPVRAALLITLGSIMFLPELASFDWPLIPPLDKGSLPALCLLVGVLTAARPQLRRAREGSGVNFLMLLTLVGAIGTVVTNPDTLRYGATVIPGLESGDVPSTVIRSLLGSIAYFFVARTLFRTADDAKALLRALAIAGILYIPLIIIELRLSPQLHNWIYGYGQHSFAQTKRDGGYRPMVFMAHGLALALFLCNASLACFTLAKSRARVLGFSATTCGFVLLVVLALCKSTGSLLYTLVGLPLIWFLRPRTQVLVAVILVSFASIYPIARAAQVFPDRAMVDFFARYSVERAESLDFRFKNEERLLEKALERPLFGWGGFGRNRVYNERGKDISVTDGAWIISLGIRGALGFVCQFGLFLMPAIAALRRIRRVPPAEQHLLAGCSLIAALCAVDLLPNGVYSDLPMFISGAVAGLAYGMSEPARQRAGAQALARLLYLLRRISNGQLPQLPGRRPAASTDHLPRRP
jgi:hypothetical protein